MILHFLSTGPHFPYTYYLGVLTALKAHRGQVKLWITEEPKSRYFDLLKGKVEILKVKEPFPDFPALKNKDLHFKRVAKFDYFIWKIVAKEGGIIMGLDSITLKDWQGLLKSDKEMLVPRDSEKDNMSFSMHGVIIRQGSELAKQVCELAEVALNSDDMNFGDAGIVPYLHVVHQNLDKVTIVDYGLVGGCNHDGKPFYLWREDGELLHPDCRTIPIYATSETKAFGKINEDYIANSKSLLARLVKEKLLDGEWKIKISGDRKKRKFRFHLLGLAHLPVSEEYMGCAFTQKIVKLSKMLLSLGHEVFLYGAEGSDAPCTEFIQTHSLKDIRDAWGEGDNRFEIGYDWKTKNFKHDFNTTRTPATLKYYANCVNEINKRKKDDDFLLLSMGTYQKPIDDAVGLYLTCEPGIGYRGSYTRFRAFESAYLMNFTYGSEYPRQSINGNYYHRVIPNYFDPKDFPFQEKKGDYFLYMGRIIQRKGVWTAIKATEAIGVKLKIAGQTDPEIDVNKLPAHCEFVGFADPEKRAKLMGEAKAVFVPTQYLEAFGGVAVEAMLCGTAIITTNFGVFPEYNQSGITGYCCDTLNDFVEAAKNVHKLDPKVIRKHSERYLIDNVKWEFEKWFQDLYQLFLSAQNPKVKGWHNIDEI